MIKCLTNNKITLLFKTKHWKIRLIEVSTIVELITEFCDGLKYFSRESITDTCNG